MKAIKNTMKVGMASMLGQSVLGSMASSTNLPSSTYSSASAGLQLANVGSLAKTGLDISKSLGKMHKKRK